MPTITKDSYVISDLHLGHTNILTYCRWQFNSIEEHDEHIIEKLSKVPEGEWLWVLGDVCFQRKKLQLLKNLKCNLGLIGGNHDHFRTQDYMEVFKKVRGVGQVQFENKNIVLTHIPVHPDQFERWTHNIHGHLHTKILPDPRYINVSCEQYNFKPVKIKDLFSELE